MSNRESLPSVPWFASLLALGFAIGLAWNLVQPHRAARTVEAPWIRKAIRAVVPAALGGTPDAKLPPFALRGTMIASDPKNSTATFDLGKGGVHVLGPGATLPGVGRLLEVAHGSAFVEVDGRRLQVFIESEPASGSPIAPLQSVAQNQVQPIALGLDVEPGSVNQKRVATKPFVVPSNIQRLSDAPPDQPELNASPRPGQSIDTTVWD